MFAWQPRQIVVLLGCWLLMIGSPAALRAQSGEARGLTFDDLKFPIEKDQDFVDDMLTPEILALEGTRIRISGYILPSFRQSGIEKFVFVRDNMECCFGPGAMLYDCMIVELAEGGAIEYTVRPITVEGTFKLKQFKGPDKKIRAVFRLVDAQKL